MVYSFRWRVSLWREGRVQIRAIITLVGFFTLSIALEITRGAGEPELVRGGFSLVPDAPFGV
jgi:hypothetical protein